MSQWVFKGLRTGIKSTRYPYAEETAAGTSPGLPAATKLPAEMAQMLVACCPTDALERSPTGVDVNPRQCIHCLRCVRATNSAIQWEHGYEWAGAVSGSNAQKSQFGSAFDRSVHILVVDAGDCGACLNEVRQLNNPYYNMHRLGFFLTPTPRHADVLLVVGALTDHMRVPLRKAYDAMPNPKRVVAVGTCALSGGIFGQSFICAGGVTQALPVDVEVPGNPPPPLAILHGLLVAVGRKPPAGSHRRITGSAGNAPV
jgi:Ni,Fe-hydrogenase III small subunit/ferredoxin-like protein FixX